MKYNFYVLAAFFYSFNLLSDCRVNSFDLERTNTSDLTSINDRVLFQELEGKELCLGFEEFSTWSKNRGKFVSYDFNVKKYRITLIDAEGVKHKGYCSRKLTERDCPRSCSSSWVEYQCSFN